MCRRETHILTLTTTGKSFEIRFIDEALADVPGQAGNETLMATIRCGINELS
jgi:hypothetical protein